MYNNVSLYATSAPRRPDINLSLHINLSLSGTGLGITIPKIDRAVIENIVGHGSKENVV
jgi:hypothetical protein